MDTTCYLRYHYQMVDGKYPPDSISYDHPHDSEVESVANEAYAQNVLVFGSAQNVLV